MTLINNIGDIIPVLWSNNWVDLVSREIFGERRFRLHLRILRALRAGHTYEGAGKGGGLFSEVPTPQVFGHLMPWSIMTENDSFNAGMAAVIKINLRQSQILHTRITRSHYTISGKPVLTKPSGGLQIYNPLHARTVHLVPAIPWKFPTKIPKRSILQNYRDQHPAVSTTVRRYKVRVRSWWWSVRVTGHGRPPFRSLLLRVPVLVPFSKRLQNLHVHVSYKFVKPNESVRGCPTNFDRRSGILESALASRLGDSVSMSERRER